MKNANKIYAVIDTNVIVSALLTLVIEYVSI